MRYALSLAAFCFFIIGCFSKPVPQWQNNAHGYLENFKNAYFAGKEKIAAVYFKKAEEQIRATGDLDLLTKTYLFKCAVTSTTLTAAACDDAAELCKKSGSREHAAYLAFISGETPVAQDLPEQYRKTAEAIAAKNFDGLKKLIEDFDSPVSQLIAISAAAKLGAAHTDLLEYGSSVASAQGWKTPLRYYLSMLEKLYRQNGNNEKEQQTKIRLEILGS